MSDTNTDLPINVDIKVQHVPATSIKPYYRNTKHHSEEQVRKMAKMLDRFSFDQPIVVDANMVIIKGHGRYMAALLAQTKTLLPVVVRDDLTKEQVQAARIADNRIFDLGEAIPDLIHSELNAFVAEGGQGAEAFFDFMAPQELDLAPAPKIAKSKLKAQDDLVAAIPVSKDSDALNTDADSKEDLEQDLMSVQEALKTEAVKVKAQKAKPVQHVHAIHCPNCGAAHEENAE